MNSGQTIFKSQKVANDKRGQLAAGTRYEK
jgi:hypothetical protein